MTDWIDFAVYAAFLLAVWFVNPTTQHRLTVPLLADRNAEWVAEHPDFVRGLERSRWRIWISYALGAISLGVLASFQLGLWMAPPMRNGAAPIKWAVLWNLTMMSMVVSLLIWWTITLATNYALRRRIPVAPRRQATLERRSLDDSVPRWVQIVVYALVIADIAAWVVAAIKGTHTSPVFWPRVITMFFLSGFFFLVTRATVVRRANTMDRIFGPTYRRGEMRFVFSMQILTPIIGALRLYEEVTGTMLLDMSRALQLFLAALITYAFLRMARLAAGVSEAASVGG